MATKGTLTVLRQTGWAHAYFSTYSEHPSGHSLCSAVPCRQIGAQVMALSMFINLTLLDSNKQSLLDLHSLPIVTPLLRSTSVRRPPVRPPSHAHAHAHKRPRGANTVRATRQTAAPMRAIVPCSVSHAVRAVVLRRTVRHTACLWCRCTRSNARAASFAT